MQKTISFCIFFLGLFQIIYGLHTPSVLAEYNAFVKNDFNSQNSDCEGRLAAGGNVDLKNYGIGHSFTFSCERKDLIVGSVLTFADGAVGRGGIGYGEAAYIDESVYVYCDNIQQDYEVYFEYSFEQITAESEEFGEMDTTGIITGDDFGMINLNGKGNDLEIFNISLDDNTHTINVKVDGNSYTIINVHGYDLEIRNFQINLEGSTNLQKIIWNFPDAISLKLENLSFKGAVVAPKAEVHFDNGNIDGSFISSSYSGTGEFHYYPFITPNDECTCEPCQKLTFPETFSTFIRNNVNRTNTDDQGRLACGGDAILRFFGIGSRLVNSFGSRTDLFVVGNALLEFGEVFFGNAVVNGNVTLNEVSFPNGNLLDDPIYIDFESIFELLIFKSKIISLLWCNGETVLNYGTNLELNGNDRFMNFFNLSPSDLNEATSININVPDNSFVIISVKGVKNTLNNLQMFLNGTPYDHILWNFYRTRSLLINSVGIAGSVLAPMADVTFVNGNLDGTLIANSLQGNGEIHYEVFEPVVLPCTPCNCNL
eukprot:TRINITY_DN508_c0_g2_i1.p1 TRINITY_DN508_c0_g2~~TRINITY_DN508_c0_g2_i1.p1  ORF type:complete len:540 (-),score=166.46 TRINITY_DN508_c0_g2_i1:150-1769(-)